MHNEEMQNTMQFILNQQAQTTINLDKLGEKVDKITEAQAAYERRAGSLQESFQVLVQLAANMDGRMDTLSINIDRRMDAFERRTGRLEESFQLLVQLAANTDGRIDVFEKRTGKLEESFQLLVQLAANMDGRLDTSSANTDRRIDALTAAQERTDRQLARTNQQLAQTDKQLARTDGNLSALIDTFERYISEGRNGRS